jgi:hypothetical protein
MREFFGDAPNASGLAMATMFYALLDHLIVQDILTRSDVRSVLARARSELFPHSANALANQAREIIDKMLVRFPEENL